MDLILYNGNIATMDTINPKAEAIAIKGKKIYAVGKDHDILSLKEQGTKIIDLNKKTLVPGFNDSHMHILEYARKLDNISLKACRSIDEMKMNIMNSIKKKELIEDEFVIASDWNDDQFLEKRFPRKEDLDSIPVEQPIIAVRRCVNIAVLNSKAIKLLLPVLNKAYNNQDGSVQKNNEGFTGLLKGTNIISDIIPPLEKNKIKELLLKGFDDCIKNGITSIQTDDFLSANMKDVLNVYFELDKNNELPIRINKQLRLPTFDALNSFLEMGYKTKDGSDFFKIGPLKLIADGTLGGRTALLREPYSDKLDSKGSSIYEQEYLNDIVFTAHKRNLQIAVHAIGDRAMDIVLEAYNNALKKHPKSSPRFRIIHGQITSEDLIYKFKKNNIIIDVQPMFISSDLPIVESRVGSNRAKWTYNWKTAIKNGIKIGASSDAPVESFNPLLGIYAFVNRKTLDGNPKGSWLPEEKLTVEEGVNAYTMGSAYCSFEEDLKGSIRKGKLADFAILSDDIFKIEPDKIKEVEVEKTIVDGEIVYEK